MSSPRLALRGVCRAYKSGDERLDVLRDAELALADGEIVALVAPSGTGKSTLLHVAGLLDRPDSGEVLIDGAPCGTLPDRKRTEIRRLRVGFVYQFHHLLPEFTAAENVILPQMLAGAGRAEAAARATDLLTAFGLGARTGHLPGQLSGGEQQRAAIARALANRPAVLLADEPTGNLDVRTSDTVFDELLRLVRGQGVAALIATHNAALAARMDRVLTLREGRLVPA